MECLCLRCNKPPSPDSSDKYTPFRNGRAFKHVKSAPPHAQCPHNPALLHLAVPVQVAPLAGQRQPKCQHLPNQPAGVVKHQQLHAVQRGGEGVPARRAVLHADGLPPQEGLVGVARHGNVAILAAVFPVLQRWQGGIGREVSGLGIIVRRHRPLRLAGQCAGGF